MRASVARRPLHSPKVAANRKPERRLPADRQGPRARAARSVRAPIGDRRAPPVLRTSVARSDAQPREWPACRAEAAEMPLWTPRRSGRMQSVTLLPWPINRESWSWRSPQVRELRPAQGDERATTEAAAEKQQTGSVLSFE